MPVYNTKAVSVRTGVPADTLRAWERRYGVPKPHRTQGAQRLYSERDIASIRWLKQHTDRGLSIRQAIALLQATAHAAPVEVPAEPSDTILHSAEQLFDALTSLDTSLTDRLLSEAFARYGLETACLEVIQPALYRIGEEWAAGNLPISVEHFSSYLIRGKLSSLLGSYSHSGTLGPVVSACAEGEQHELGLMMLALFLMRRGVRVIHLGADLPARDLAGMIQRVAPRLICLSASTPHNAHTLLNAIEELAHVHGIRPPIAIGGYAFSQDPALRERTGGLWLGADARGAADTIRNLVAQPH